MTGTNKNVNLADALDHIVNGNGSECESFNFLTMNRKIQILTILKHNLSMMSTMRLKLQIHV